MNIDDFLPVVFDSTVFTDFNDFPVFNPDLENYVPPSCTYIDTENLYSYVNSLSLFILLLNIRSIKRNFNGFMADFCNYLNMFSFIVFTETWLTVDRDKAFNIPGFYSLNLYRDQYGGGLRLYVKDCFKAKVLNDFLVLNEFYEILTVEVDLCFCRCVLVLVYHPPSSSFQRNQEFINLFILKLSAILNLKMPVIVAGDFNLNLFNPNNFNYIDAFIDNMLELNFMPTITRPTRVSLRNQTLHYSLLDQIWVSAGINHMKSFVIPASITDHFPVCLVIDNMNLVNNSLREVEIRKFTDSQKDTFKECLNSIKLVITTDNKYSIFNAYYEKLFLAYNIAFPVTRRRVKERKSTPWMTDKLRECIIKKGKLYKLYLRGRISKTYYTGYRNKLTHLIRKVKRLYYTRLFIENAHNSKRIWDILNDLLNRKSRAVLDELRANGVKLKGKVLVDYINEFFINTALNISVTISSPSVLRCLAPRVVMSCFFRPASVPEILDIIRKLKLRGNRIFDIHPLLIKENMQIFGEHTRILYNLSLEISIFPDPLKVARVTPVFKSGDSDNIDNYRPISSLPVLSKLFERLTLNRMLSFIYAKEILSPCQFGFKKGCDVSQAVVKLTSHIIQAFHSKLYSACFFLDLRKAFDTVSHELLFIKLEHYGFRGECLNFLKSYFCNRKQFVYSNGFKSTPGSVVCGVPQGSILGPICFSLFINDLPSAVDSDTVLFADDAAFIVTSDTFVGLIEKIQKLFSDLTTYLNMNRMIPNSRKSKLMAFKSHSLPVLPDISFYEETIEWVTDFKYLGITLTNTMNFSKHIKNVSNKVSQVTGTILNLRTFVPQCILIKLYYALIYPHLNANIIVWGSAPESHLRPLRVRLNNLLRTILGVTWSGGRPSMNTSEIFNILSLLKLSSIFKLNLFKFLKLILDGNLPHFWELLMARYVTPHSYGTRRIGYRCPNVSCEVERRGLSYQLIMLLEELPAGLMELSFNLSKRKYKRILMEGQ